jgi:amidase
MSDLSVQTRWLDATGQAELVRSGQVTALELLEAAIERIETLDPVVNAVVMRWFDHARHTVAGPVPDGVFRGVPFLLKDWMAAYAGQPCASGNRRLKEAALTARADSALVIQVPCGGPGDRRPHEQPGVRQRGDDGAPGVGGDP